MNAEYLDTTDPNEPPLPPTRMDKQVELVEYWEAVRTLQETLDYARKAYIRELVELSNEEIDRRYSEFQRLTGEIFK